MEVASKIGTENVEIDSGSALQAYLNSIPISSFPNISLTPVVEVQATDLLKDAIHKLYQKNASVALITDSSAGNADTNVVAIATPSDRYIGIISFASMVLWCLQQMGHNMFVQPPYLALGESFCGAGQFHKDSSHHNTTSVKTKSFSNFFSRLDQDPQIKNTKVAELAKLFLWDPFFPVHLEDNTFFHVLLMLSKHRLHVVPVIERSKNRVIGFITQNAVIELLLKSDGLEWVDSIANSALSEFRFERKDSACQVYEDQSVSEALSILLEKRVAALAVVQRNTRELVGTIRDSDISLLLENDVLLTDRKTTLKEFIKMNNNDNHNNSMTRMDSPVIHRETDILKKVMAEMVENNSETSFLVDESYNVVGMISLRDIIVEFAPPCVDSRFDGGGFFESALQQTGCHIENGTTICDQ